MEFGLEIGREYISNNYGIYTVIDILHHPDAKYNKHTALIKFKLTNYVYETTLLCARDGVVRDPTLLHTIPIDMLCLDINERERRLRNIAKIIWKGMCNRCNNRKSINHDRYGNKGITVCNEWLNNFETFFLDIQSLFQYDKWARFPTLYNLDKDYKAYLNNITIENRYYSKDTCIFLHYMDNTNLRSIEYRTSCNNKLTSKYFGVDSRNNNGKILYRPRLYVNNKEVYFGNYDNEEVAAAVYNYYYLKYHSVFPRFEIIPLLNDVPSMLPEEFIKYNLTAKEMVSII